MYKAKGSSLSRKLWPYQLYGLVFTCFRGKAKEIFPLYGLIYLFLDCVIYIVRPNKYIYILFSNIPSLILNSIFDRYRNAV